MGGAVLGRRTEKRDCIVKKSILTALRVGAAPIAIGLAFASAPAFAQDDTTVEQSADDTEEESVIVVTGSLFSRPVSVSPVTSLSAETLEQRGINTVSEAVQRIPANGAGTIQTGWNTGFNFASGANAVSLRGLTVQSTLSMFDGLRMAPYPLADDGQRNFVDLNTVPSAIVERIDVLRDGASSTYGADAVAGVVNIITKKQIQGLHLNASAGISQEGDGSELRGDVTYGYGDLNDQGFNFYISAEYQKQDDLWARDRDYPFNSADLSQICGESGSCMHNGNWNGYTPEDGLFNGLISVPGVGLVRRGSLTTPTTGTGRFEYLNPAADCGNYPMHTNIGSSTTAPLAGVCEVDFQNQYIMLAPEIERWGVSGRFTVNLGADHQLYAQGNYYRTNTFASFTPLGFNGTPTPPIPAGLGAYNVMLPVYICPTGLGTRDGLNTGCDAANGTLNPYNPFAAEGRTAQMFIRSTRPRTVETDSRALRGVLGLEGSFGEGWRYSANFTASEVKLTRDQGNYFIPQRIMDAVARGMIDFNDLEANSQDVWDFISPLNSTVSTSDLWQVQGVVTKELIDLPGGMANLAVGASYREESIDAPSANPQIDFLNIADQYERYYSINSVGTSGSRNVKSAFFELMAPIVDELELTVSGRYDDYSTGQENFSPKVGLLFSPIPELQLRGTWAKGFRIPSFNESFGLPTTGYVTQGGSTFCASYAAFCAAHGSNAYASQSFSVGLTQVGNPALDPEKSTSYNFGVSVEPISNVRLTVDLWRIEVDNLIVGVTNIGPVIDQYYQNGGVVSIPGVTVIQGQPDPAFPNALPHIGFIQAPYQNADSQVVQGIDFGINAGFDVTDAIRLTSSLEGSWLHKSHLTPIDPFTGEVGDVLEYEGTLSPCNITSCSGTPRWRLTWQNSLEFGDTTVAVTTYYTSGYDMASVDFGATPGDCESAVDFGSAVTYVDGTPVLCHSKDIWNVDLTATHKFGERFTVYANILNVLGIDAPFDPSAAYHLFNYNPAWAGPNIMGRYFRLGAKFDF